MAEVELVYRSVEGLQWLTAAYGQLGRDGAFSDGCQFSFSCYQYVLKVVLRLYVSWNGWSR